MILAGEIGATRTRLAAFETEGNSLSVWSRRLYMSQEHGGLAGDSSPISSGQRASRCKAHALGSPDP